MMLSDVCRVHPVGGRRVHSSAGARHPTGLSPFQPVSPLSLPAPLASDLLLAVLTFMLTTFFHSPASVPNPV